LPPNARGRLGEGNHLQAPWSVMQKSRIRALRQAQLYGYLIDRTGRLYYPGGSHPVCTVQIAHEMVRDGWLIRRDTRYEITREGLRVLALEAHSHMRADA
jgi:hypothetical protein